MNYIDKVWIVKEVLAFPAHKSNSLKGEIKSLVFRC